MEAAVVVKDLIEQERVVCAELAQVLHAERDALTRFSADGVTECVRRKDGLHARLSALARERRRAVDDLARVLGLRGGDGRVASLLPGLPSAMAAEIRHAVAGLRQVLLETRRLQRVNGVLADASLRMVGELLRAYRQLLPGTRYDGRAMVTPGPSPDALDQRV
jgi:flagellar biosynthesis/type III secretory pathway chaperone